MDIDLDRGLTRLYLLAWALWLLYLLLQLTRVVFDMPRALVEVGLVGLLLPALLLLALKWVAAGFRPSRNGKS